MNRIFIFFALLLLVPFLTLAQIPRTLSYQGMLTDSTGNTTKPDGNYSFTFKLYDSTTAIWEETKTLQVSKGLFSTALGDATPFGAAVKFDKQYWLGVKVGNEAELTPRTQLTSVGYSMNALRADTAKYTTSDGTWTNSGFNIYRLNGNVGIGTTNPVTKLQVVGGDLKLGGARLHTDEPAEFFWTVNGKDYRWRDSSVTFYANSYKLEHDGSGEFFFNKPHGEYHWTLNGNDYRWRNNSVTFYANDYKLEHLGTENFLINKPIGGNLVFNMVGNIGIGTFSPTAKLEVLGRTKTKVLEITGGSDLAEPFEITNSEMLEPGSVVVIDEHNPGKLKLSSKPYDKRVAGVVSGAGGIQPGLTLKQEGIMEGNQNIALNGRVYVKATTENGAITPGDLLTTSSLSGYVMKATDETKSHGTIIGKAMSALNEGTGLVLVLVNLQ